MIERHPEIVYVIAGRTHPDVAQREGERYRLMLERRVLELDLVEHVEFDDRFLSIDELSDLLAATDVSSPRIEIGSRSPPARSPSQSRPAAPSSPPRTGTHRTCSPPARAGSSPSTTQPRSPTLCATTSSSRTAWPRRGRRRGASGPRLPGRRSPKRPQRCCKKRTSLRPRRRPVGVADLQLTSLRTDHLLTLVDDVGIVQHAHGIIPNRDSGYCVDDVARLAVVSLALARRGDEQAWTSTLYKALAFLHAAAEGEGGMRNFMGYDRRWLDEPHMGDHVGRSVWALGDILATAWIPAVVEPTRNLLERIVGSLADDVSLRTAAYTVLGLSRLDADRLDRPARRLLERLVEQLADAYEQNASDEWRWFEGALSYDNARLSQALLSGGSALGRDDLVETGLESLRWLGDECGLERGTLRLPGHHGRRRNEAGSRGGRRAAARRCRARRGRARRLRDHARRRARRARQALVRVVPRAQPSRSPALRLRHRRLQRRPRRARI